MTESPKVNVNFMESLWRFFASLRLTVVVLLTLAVVSIIGTLIRQDLSPAENLRAFGPFFYQMMATLDLFDLFHAWWFQSLILILCINIIVCSINRLQSTWRTILIKPREVNLAQFRQRKSRQEFRRKGNVEVLKPLFQKRVTAAFHQGKLIPAEAGFAVAVDKGRWTRLGVYGVHLSIVVLLIGALVSSQFGFDGYVNIPEGERANAIQLRNSVQQLALPFTIQCDDFDVQFYEGGRRPKEFRSKISILQGDRTVYQKDIVMNDPLRYQGINIFQSSYGEMEGAQTAVDLSQPLPEKLDLNLRSVASGMIYNKSTTLNQAMELPEGLGTLTIVGFEPNADFKGMAVGPSLVGRLEPKEGEPQSILLPFNHPGFDGMRRGAFVISIATAIPRGQPRYYTGLQVTKDPGVWLVYAGFILMITGCVVVFFMSHQRLVVEAQPDGSGVHVTVSGTTNKNKVGYQLKIKRLAAQLEKVE
jgi:cytochrome c biogenesis protein